MSDLADRIIEAYHLADLPPRRAWDPATCPGCFGERLMVSVEMDYRKPQITSLRQCPFCRGDGSSPAERRRRAEVAALERMWGAE